MADRAPMGEPWVTRRLDRSLAELQFFVLSVALSVTRLAQPYGVLRHELGALPEVKRGAVPE